MQTLQKIKRFNDIYEITKSQTKKEKGDLFELFIYHLFKLDPRLNNKLEKIWLYEDVPKKVIDYLKLPNTDKGIYLCIHYNKLINQ
jgi:predicted helicase